LGNHSFLASLNAWALAPQRLFVPLVALYTHAGKHKQLPKAAVPFARASVNQAIARAEEVLRTIVRRSIQGINHKLWHPDVDFFTSFVSIRNYPVSRDMRLRQPSGIAYRKTRVAHDQHECIDLARDRLIRAAKRVWKLLSGKKDSPDFVIFEHVRLRRRDSYRI